MKICFLLTRRVPDAPSPTVLKVQRLLGGMRHEVTGQVPKSRLLRTGVLAPETDLYVLKSYTELILSCAGALHGQRIAMCNGYGTCLIAQGKVTAGRFTRELCVPTPETWLIGSPQQTIGLLAEKPLIIRPHRGHRGMGLHLIGEAAQLTLIQAPPEPLIAQRYVSGPGEDLKVYVAGKSVWAVRRPFDPQSFTRFGRSIHTGEETRDITARARSGFDLGLFGRDVIGSPDDPRVVDVNYFPGYEECPDPAPVIAATIDCVVRGS